MRPYTFVVLLLVGWCSDVLAAASVSADGFRRAAEPWNWSFPRDHGNHPQFQTEWWYFTGALQSQDGNDFGYELTFFRFALRSQKPVGASTWRTRDLILAHFAVTDVAEQRFHLEERLQRAAAGLAGATTDSLHVWLDDWHIQSSGDEVVVEAGDDNHVRLSLQPQRRPILHGDAGLSWKSDDHRHASYHYSIPRMKTTGTLTLQGRKLQVSGTTWMDHEFFTGDTPAQGLGWDWFSCRLDDGRDLMLYLLRHPDGTRYRSGTLVEVDGSHRPLQMQDMVLEPLRQWTSPRTQSTYPVQWRLTLPREELELQVTARIDDQEVHATETIGFAYWEGLSRYSGKIRGKAVQGEGYVELTGYDQQQNGSP